MKRLPRIVKITAVEPPFNVNTVWTNGEERWIDLSSSIAFWKTQGDERFTGLEDWEVFKQVTVSPEHTLCWQNLPQALTLPSGKIIGGALDLDPDVLYQESKLLKSINVVPHIGELLKKAREEVGLSQGQVALNSGTTRAYISKVETGKSDIQLNTLYRLITLGIGRELSLTIK